MADQFGMAKLMLGRCPSCYYNFRSLFCAMTCGPDHSRFLNVTSWGNSSMYPGRTTVESIDYYLADDFAERTVESCRLVFCFQYFVFICDCVIRRDVLYPGGNQHSLDTMCGRPYDQCTKQSFMQYLGVDNPAAPFPIHIILINDTSESDSFYNQTTFLCSESLVSQYENRTACGCLVN